MSNTGKTYTMTDVPNSVSSLLDPTMLNGTKIFEIVEAHGAKYYFIDQIDEDGGEPVIIRESGGKAEILEDFPDLDDPAVGGASALSTRLQERKQAMQTDDGGAGGAAAGGPALTQGQISTKFAGQAERCAEGGPEELSSATAAGTDGGNLACAWAVNQVALKALKKQIGGGLSTANMAPILRSSHTKRTAPVRGCVIISPTVTRANGTRNIGHVGIIGEVDGDNTKIYSNSSSKAVFSQNFTLKRWIEKYKNGKGLSVEMYELSPVMFPAATV